MSRPAESRPLTELEGAALGVVARDGPCTAYSVKEVFRASPSDFWSGSAGSIYPLMKRLEDRGLLISESSSTGRRGSQLYRVTRGGRAAFRRWLTDVERATAIGFDPLRTRMVFLSALSPGALAAFRDAVDVALSEAASGPDDPWMETLHESWNDARRRAFARVISRLR